jgi:hypothetical protein
MSAEGLAAALRDLGVDCAIEARGKLAVLLLAGDAAPLERDEGRRAALALLGAHGFTHLALELFDDAGDGAPLPRA